jgi:hypothetical protein
MSFLDRLLWRIGSWVCRHDWKRWDGEHLDWRTRCDRCGSWRGPAPFGSGLRPLPEAKATSPEKE